MIAEIVLSKPMLVEVIIGTSEGGGSGLPGKNGLSAYELALLDGFVGTPTEWLASLKGNDGKSLEFTWNGTNLGVRKEGDANYSYVDLKGASAYEVAVQLGFTGTAEEFITSLKGADGHTPVISILPNGNWAVDGSDTGTKAQGVDGKSVEIQKTSTAIQWRREGDVNWIDLILLSSLVGEAGKSVELQKSATAIQWRREGEVNWHDLALLSDLKGENGVSPHIGENGNWVIGTNDTGVKAQGKDGQSAYEAEKAAGTFTGNREEWIAQFGNQRSHLNNGDIHVTAEKKASWDGIESRIKGGVGADGDTLYKLKALIDNLKTFVNGDDVNLDSVKELADYIKANKTLLDQVTTNKVNTSDIVNTLDCIVEGKVLDARQGKALKTLIDNLTTTVAGKLEKGTLPAGITSAQNILEKIGIDQNADLTTLLANTSNALFNALAGASKDTLVEIIKWLIEAKADTKLTQNKIEVGNSSNLREEVDVYDEFVSVIPNNVGQRFDAGITLIARSNPAKLVYNKTAFVTPTIQAANADGLVFDLIPQLTSSRMIVQNIYMLVKENGNNNTGETLGFDVGTTASNNIVNEYSFSLDNSRLQSYKIPITGISADKIINCESVKIKIRGKSANTLHVCSLEFVFECLVFGV